MKLILFVDCSGVWFFFIYPLKNMFHCKFVIQSDGCLIPRCLSTIGNSGEKLLLCQSLLFVSHCFAVRNLDAKRGQLCFRVQFCLLLRYLRVMRQSHKETYGLPLLFISSLSKWFRKFKIYYMHKNISLNWKISHKSLY